MPPLRDLLADDVALRALIATTPPRVLARRINGSMGGSLDLVRELIDRIMLLYVELWGLAYAEEFRQELKF